MVDFTTLMGSFTTSGDSCSVVATDDWLQGRTIYGGLAAAFCVESATRQLGDLPPLRSAQFAFIGPATGAVTMRPTVLRKGKSTVFAGVDLTGEAGLATRGLLCYGTARTSAVTYGHLPAPSVGTPDTYPEFFRQAPAGLNFIQHFDARLVDGHLPFSASEYPSFTVWLRHRDQAKPASVTALVALTDAPPPGALVKFHKPLGPISTMTWAIDFVTDKLETRDGWWLLRTTAETVLDGYSSQATTLWNANGEPVLVCRQNVAVFM